MKQNAGYMKFTTTSQLTTLNLLIKSLLVFIKTQLLKDFPEIGYQYRTEPEGEIRILLYGHYRIAYLIRSQQQIDILGVFHGAMAIENHLKLIDVVK